MEIITFIGALCAAIIIGGAIDSVMKQKSDQRQATHDIEKWQEESEMMQAWVKWKIYRDGWGPELFDSESHESNKRKMRNDKAFQDYYAANKEGFEEKIKEDAREKRF
jgi:hypothetical protein